MVINPSSLLNPLKKLDIASLSAGVWPQLNNRIVSVINKPGLSGAALIIGSALGNCMDHRSWVDLSCYCDHLRYFNINKLGEVFLKKYSNSGLVLRACRLTDDDLKRLKEGGWFKHFKSINMSDNPQITAKGLLPIQGERAHLYILDLSRTGLNDSEVTKLAGSDLFKELTILKIRGNPQVTGKSLIQIAKSGFTGMLDIGDNPQLLGKGLDEWIEKAEFERLSALGLKNTDLTTEELQRMIDKTEWFKNMQGLDLDLNVQLKKLPSNISQMTQLGTRSISDHLQGAHPLFDGSGLFIQDCPNLKFSKGLRKLMTAEKVFMRNNLFRNSNYFEAARS